MPVSLVASTSSLGSSVDTTGANLIVLVISDYQTSFSVSDNKSNSYTQLTAVSGQWSGRIAYCLNPTVGSGHSWTITGGFNSWSMAAFSGVGAGGFDKQGTTNGSGTANTLTHGSLTPAADNSLVVAGFCTGDNAGVLNSVNGGFSVAGSPVSGASGSRYGSALTYLVQTTAAAAGPTGTMSVSSSQRDGVMAVFAGEAAASKSPAFSRAFPRVILNF